MPNAAGPSLTRPRGIVAVSRALRTLVADLCGASDIPLDIAIRQAREAARFTGDGVSIVLAGAELSRDERAPMPPDSSGGRRQNPVAVDLHYLLVPHAEDAERQHELLGLLAGMAATPVIDAGALNAALDEDAFHAGERVVLAFQPLSRAGELGLASLPGDMPPCLLLSARGLTMVAPSAPPPPVDTVRTPTPPR